MEKFTNVIGLLLIMILLIFTVDQYENFSDIEYAFTVIFWWTVAGMLVLVLILPFFNSNRREITRGECKNCGGVTYGYGDKVKLCLSCDFDDEWPYDINCENCIEEEIKDD